MKVYDTIQKYKKIINNQFLVILIGTFLTALTYSMMFPYFAIYLKEKLLLSATAAATIIMVFTGFRRQGVLIGGILIDRFGHKKLFCIGLFIHVIFYFGMSMTTNYVAILILTILSTIGGALTIPTVRTLTISNVDDQYKVEAFGLRAMTFNFAIAIGPVIGSYVANYSFSTLFIGCGISYFIYFIMVLLTFEEVKSLNKSTKALVTSIKDIKTNRPALIILAMSFIFFFLSSQASSTIPMYLKSSIKVSNIKIGILFTVSAVVSVAFQQIIAGITSKLSYARVFLITLILLTGALSIYIVSENYYMFILSIIIMTFAELICIPVMYSAMIKVAPSNLKGTYSGFAVFFEGLGTSLGVYAGGIFLDKFNLKGGWIVLTLIGVVSIILLKLFAEKTISINTNCTISKS
ncbi:MFS transporter [Sporanaerobacter acetigenes]|uniref:Sugar phosphate permease n=1 Tax=Sporanaerobacter acetigenes DSM 13106 TaxID=1123281 RepID=A0A1M5Z905_9FIRM|nr:MFS transporter [Sporanaerobacter acetigenes]SHI20711.1 Sugar phosphate permease [Sporanaerobacter acetigenes DSM 13106]